MKEAAAASQSRGKQERQGAEQGRVALFPLCLVADGVINQGGWSCNNATGSHRWRGVDSLCYREIDHFSTAGARERGRVSEVVREYERSIKHTRPAQLQRRKRKRE